MVDEWIFKFLIPSFKHIANMNTAQYYLKYSLYFYALFYPVTPFGFQSVHNTVSFLDFVSANWRQKAQTVSRQPPLRYAVPYWACIKIHLTYVSYQQGGYSKRYKREAYIFYFFSASLSGRLPAACLRSHFNSLYNEINVWSFIQLRDRQLTSVGQGRIYHPVAVRATEYFSIQLPSSLMITVSSFNYGDFDQIQICDWVFNAFFIRHLRKNVDFLA